MMEWVHGAVGSAPNSDVVGGCQEGFLEEVVS